LLLSTGQVFALAQEDASGKKQFSYGVSASYVTNLSVATVDAFNSIYTKIGIRKAWASDVEQATVTLFLTAGSQDAKTYLETLNDFISTFPQAAEGYQSRASHYATKRDVLASTAAEQQNYLNLALADLNTAAKLSRNKGDTFYNQAKLIYSVAVNDSTLTDANWTVEASKAALQKAIQTEDLPVYRTLEGEINFDQGDFAEAYDAYARVNNSNMASANSFYMASKALENIPGSQLSDIIALLDSSIVRMGTPTPKEAAPYILERVEYKTQLALFKEAVEDYDLYYDLVDGKVNDGFYYYREQAKFRAGDNEGALQDIKEALKINKLSPDYYAEEAAVQVRLQNYTEALVSVQKALDLAPDFGACYRIRGVCYVRQEKKTEACQAFAKAQELGDPLVARLIKEHCQ
jgi:tetratricopeptide (TPR) repeat protein